MINARSETAATKLAFRDALKYRRCRCLIPADGFYEWMRTGKTKQPYCFEVNVGELFAFAGIWDRWKDPSGNWMKTCSILTTTANGVASPVHDRMPAILDPDSYDLWLDPAMTNMAAAADLLKPFAGTPTETIVRVFGDTGVLLRLSPLAGLSRSTFA
jgi:putative SOS response-associated peptidase YedK